MDWRPYLPKIEIYRYLIQPTKTGITEKQYAPNLFKSKRESCGYLMPLGILYTEVVYNDKIATRLEILYNGWLNAHGSASDQIT